MTITDNKIKDQQTHLSQSSLTYGALDFPIARSYLQKTKYVEN